MPITDFLRRNAHDYADEVALVEINPEIQELDHATWRDYSLVQSTCMQPYRRQITWSVFDEKANRFANLLLSRGVKKGDKVAILLMNCLEYLPIFFGVLKSGATVVPLNFRYTAEEIEYCVDLADVDILVFGPQFTGRIEQIEPRVSKNRLLFYVGSDCPTFAESSNELTSPSTRTPPSISRAAPRASPRPSCTTTRASRRLRRWSRSTTGRPTTTCFCASRRSITPVPPCTGWAASSAAARACSCAA